MPICGRTQRECFDAFSTHVRRLVAQTISPGAHVRVMLVDGGRATLAFAEHGGPTTVKLATNVGPLYFYLGQLLGTAADGRSRHRLETLEYWYRIQGDPSASARANLRWEYRRNSSKAHPRHHLHLAANLQLGTGELDLDKAHLPTGWVTIEEVIRFLIVELGHKPPCGGEWPEILAASERAFYEDFTSKRYRVPGG